MDRWRRWGPRRPTGRAGARRVRVTALAVFGVAAGLAVLLAFLFHLGVAAVVVAILGTVPALYLAYLAVPGVIRPPESGAVEKPAYGHVAGRWDPVDLGVHQVIGGGPMPPYVCRPHDELLRAVLDPAVPASRLVVLRGGSSTGKTRAAYEAVTTGQVADWQLDYPLNAAALAGRLDAGIPARTVLWLGELRQYADDAGGAAVLGRLADLLQGEGHLVVTAVWREQWTAYTAAARAGPGPADPAGVAGRLLERLPELTGTNPARVDPARGGVIDVPPEFTGDDLDAAAATGDPVLAAAAAAAAAAGQDGQVAQYLAGVPDLLDRYAGDDGDPYGQAVITAAMDATRLGHDSPLPAVLLEEAAVGYLADAQRTQPIADWRDTALEWAATELRGAVRALQPVPPPDGTGVVGYQVADYLDQHGRRTRQGQLGPASLWDALTAHASSGRDLDRLGQAAEDRGLYRHAAALWTTATTLGRTDAARSLITLLRRVSPGDTPRAARWAAAHASLDNPQAVATLLRELGQARASYAVTTLLARDPAAHASLDNLGAVAELVQALGQAGPSDAACSLATRAAAQASLDDPLAVAMLVRAMGEAGASDAACSLATRAAAQASLDNPGAVATLVRAMGETGASDAFTTLLARDPATQASLDNPLAVAMLLRELGQAGASDAFTTLLARDPATHASLDNPQAVAMLMQVLGQAGASDAVATLLARDPAAHASLDDPLRVASLLHVLGQAGASDAVATLLARDPAAHASLDDPQAVARLMQVLGEAGASDAAGALAARAANAGMFDLFLKVCPDKAASYPSGREPDRAPSQSWRWQEPASKTAGP